MQKWIDVIRLANNGNLNPDQRIEKSEEEWKSLLTEEQFYVTRKKGTERAHSSEMCNLFEPGKYACVCCNTVLFDSEEKFQSGFYTADKREYNQLYQRCYVWYVSNRDNL